MNEKPEIIVLYIDRSNGDKLHQILLNPLELKAISTQITDMFSRKNSDVLVGDKVLKLFEEVEDSNGKTDSGNIQN